MSRKAIPTVYKGIEFRSRLEAKWAIMFDLLDWPWHYEPIDLDEYIPDFFIDFGLQQFFVEIKPAMRKEEMREAMDKIHRASEGRNETFLILGGSPGYELNNHTWFLDTLMFQPGWGEFDDAYLAGCPTCKRLVPLTKNGGWGFPCCPVPNDDNKHYYHEESARNLPEIFWAEATNRSKYRRPIA
jgi:hypothetical protein